VAVAFWLAIVMTMIELKSACDHSSILVAFLRCTLLRINVSVKTPEKLPAFCFLAGVCFLA